MTVSQRDPRPGGAAGRRPVDRSGSPAGGRPRLVPRPVRGRTGPGSVWSPRPASPRSSGGCATPAARGRGPDQQVTADIFGSAPRELTWSVSLGQTLDIVRTVVDVVEEEVLRLAAPGDEVALREGVLRYSREVAFSAAQVYAEAAEARGAWDARLEALVVDAVVRAEADDSMQSRATALGWGSVASVTVVAGSTPSGSTAAAVDALRRSVARLGATALAAVQRRRLVVVLGGTTEAMKVVTAIADNFGAGPIVLGPTVPHLFAAGRSARAALSGLAAAPAWPAAPRPVLSDELLPERVLAGDPSASRVLVDRIHHPLEAPPGPAHHRHGVPRDRRLARGDGPRPVRPPQHRPVPPRPDRRGHRLRPGASTRGAHRRDRPGHGAAGRHSAGRMAGRAHRPGHGAYHPNPPSLLWRIPPKSPRNCSSGSPTPPSRAPARLDTVIALVCPGQGSQTPGFLAPWLELPGLRERAEALSDAAGVDLVTHGTTSDADTIRDTAVAQPLIVGAGLLALDALYADRPDTLASSVGWWPGTRVGEITAAAATGVLTAAGRDEPGQPAWSRDGRGERHHPDRHVRGPRRRPRRGGRRPRPARPHPGQHERCGSGRRRRHPRAARRLGRGPAGEGPRHPAPGRRSVPHRPHGPRGRRAGGGSGPTTTSATPASPSCPTPTA